MNTDRHSAFLASLPEPVDISDNTEGLARIDEVVSRGPFDATWESLADYTPPRWYQDAKFGIFLHWGVYSVPAYVSEWYSRAMYLEGSREFDHHVETYGPQDEFGYKDFIPDFTMEDFDPDEWSALFRRAGAQFVVPVAEHHDGFAMYDTDRSRWKASSMGPERDVLGDLLGSVRSGSMVAGASSHRAEHWFFMNGGSRFDSDVRDPAFQDFYGPAQREETAPHEQFLEDWLLRTAEIIDKYRPQVLWFDWWIEQPAFEPYLRRLAAYYYNRAHEWQRGVVINYKWDAFAPGTAVYDIERGAVGDIQPTVWQNDTSVSRGAWCWVEGHDYKSVEALIAELVDVVAKGGNLLLNVGPTPQGTIPEPEQKLLEGIGTWLTANGEAVYGTRPWRIAAEGPTAARTGSFVDASSPDYTGADIRFTTRTDVTGDYVYAILLRRPADGTALVKSFGTASGLLSRELQEVSVLGHRDTVSWERTAEGLRVDLPSRDDGNQPCVVKVFLQPTEVPARHDFLHG